MKLAIVIMAVVAATSAQSSYPYQPNYGQYNPAQVYNRNLNKPYKYVPTTYRPFVSSTPAPFVPSTYAPVVPKVIAVAKYTSDARNAEIVKSGNDIYPDGSFAYYFETNNGIAAQAQGTPRDFGGNPPVVPVVVDGAFSWGTPEGQTVSFTYVADENGYQPKSDAIPTPHPVPEAIVRALDYIARNAPRQ